MTAAERDTPEGVIDSHAHAFPDFLAPKAVPHLEEAGKVKAFLSGTVADLMASMDSSGVSASVVCSIATDPKQFNSILQWSQEIKNPRIIPFPSVHPRAEASAEQIDLVAESGFAGIKLHPEYQGFFIDDPGLADFYGRIERNGLILLFHAGHDIGFPDSDRSSPRRILQIHNSFPAIPLIASHLGGFRQWEEAEEHLVGKNVYLDTSYTYGHLSPERMAALILEHRKDRILFGSDSPWTDQKAAVDEIRSLGLDRDTEYGILAGNAARLLGIG